MNQFASLPFSDQIRKRSRSLGLKLLVVSGLALIMTIPALFVDNLIEERTNRAKQVTQEVGGRVGGPQTFLGPVLSIPYTVPPLYKGGSLVPGVYVVFPTQGDAAVKIRTEERRRSLFKVPVFEANLNFDAVFDLAGVPSASPAGAVLDWSRAGIVVGVSNARGALADGTITVNSKTITLVPAEAIRSANADQHLPLTYFGASAAECEVPRNCGPALLRRTTDFDSHLWQDHALHYGG